MPPASGLLFSAESLPHRSGPCSRSWRGKRASRCPSLSRGGRELLALGVHACNAAARALLGGVTRRGLHQATYWRQAQRRGNNPREARGGGAARRSRNGSGPPRQRRAIPTRRDGPLKPLFWLNQPSMIMRTKSTVCRVAAANSVSVALNAPKCANSSRQSCLQTHRRRGSSAASSACRCFPCRGSRSIALGSNASSSSCAAIRPAI